MMRENPRERPILFSGPMVHALLDGRKTVTRRIVREREGCRIDVTRDGVPVYVTGAPDDGGEPIPCPYGKRGDRLWVRETWRPRPSLDVEGIPDGAGVWVQYAADGAEVFVEDRRIPDTWTLPKAARRGNVSPLLMPRWASRILLEITDIRVERLHDITEEDARAEGVTPIPRNPEGDCWSDGTHRTAFEYLWGQINGWDSWASDPWVWRIEFRRVGTPKNPSPEPKFAERPHRDPVQHAAT